MPSESKSFPDRQLMNRLNNALAGVNNTINNIGLELLWTNPNPTSSFGAQSVNLSRSVDNGDICLILHGQWESTDPDAYGSTTIAIAGFTTYIFFVSATENNRNGARTALISGNTCTFSNCTYNNSTSNLVVKPFSIYALKPSKMFHINGF